MKEALTRFANARPVGKIDREAGIIYGVSIVTGNREATGHEVYIDETFVKQVIEGLKEKEPVGLKSRFDHPNPCARSVGTAVGRFHDPRWDEDQARADLHLFDAAAISPDGDLRNYVLDLAAEDPGAFATSIVFRPDDTWTPDPALKGKPGQPPETDPYWFPHARLKVLHHCDIVDEGAANEGLFGRPDYMAEQAERWAEENPGIIDRILTKWESWKTRKKGDPEMDELKELKAKLATLTTERDELAGSVDKLEKAKKEEFDAGVDQGREEMEATIKRRMESFEDDAAFVIETIAMTDAEVQAEYSKRLKEKVKNLELAAENKKTDGGAPSVGSDAGGDDQEQGAGDDADSESWEAKVAEKTKELGTRGKALRACANEFPELHEAWLAKQPHTNDKKK